MLELTKIPLLNPTEVLRVGERTYLMQAENPLQSTAITAYEEAYMQYVQTLWNQPGKLFHFGTSKRALLYTLHNPKTLIDTAILDEDETGVERHYQMRGTDYFAPRFDSELSQPLLLNGMYSGDTMQYTLANGETFTCFMFNSLAGGGGYNDRESGTNEQRQADIKLQPREKTAIAFLWRSKIIPILSDPCVPIMPGGVRRTIQ